MYKHAGSSAVVLFALVVFGLMLVYPAAALQSSLRGVTIWWEVLFPALFPFFVIAELLLGFGIVHFFGTLLDPIMRPLFRVPGIGGFVMAMGFASGYPVGARLTSQLWDDKLITRDEGERLVAFTSTADPIFLIGAVAVGFFHDAGLALILLISHYGSCVLVGLIMRSHGSPAAPMAAESAADERPSLLYRAFEAMHVARMNNQKPFGLLLQHAIQSSLRLVFVIGGLVVFFSAALELLTVSNWITVLHAPAAALLVLLHIPEQLAPSIVNGVLEVTLGAKSAGSVDNGVPLVHKVAAAVFVLSWAGLSVHAQVASLLSHTPLRYAPFAAARLLHGLLAAAAVYVLWSSLLPAGEHLESALAAWGIAETYHPAQALLYGPAILLLLLGAAALIAAAYMLLTLARRLTR